MYDLIAVVLRYRSCTRFLVFYPLLIFLNFIAINCGKPSLSHYSDILSGNNAKRVKDDPRPSSICEPMERAHQCEETKASALSERLRNTIPVQDGREWWILHISITLETSATCCMEMGCEATPDCKDNLSEYDEMKDMWEEIKNTGIFPPEDEYHNRIH